MAVWVQRVMHGTHMLLVFDFPGFFVRESAENRRASCYGTQNLCVTVG